MNFPYDRSFKLDPVMTDRRTTPPSPGAEPAPTRRKKRQAASFELAPLKPEDADDTTQNRAYRALKAAVLGGAFYPGTTVTLAKLYADVTQDLGPVDILLNAAGVFYPTPAGATPEADFDRMVDINLKGNWHMICGAVPAMKARRSGKIICIASVAASYGVAPFSIYCATKAAVVQMVRTLALELAPHGVQINAIAPGNTASPMNQALRSDPSRVAAIAAVTPSGRAFSDVADIAAIALFLASDDSRAMHGSCLLADEGISCGTVAH